jgi:hypothetical protein
MHELKLRPMMRVTDMILVQPAGGLPHLPGVLTDLTVDQALDVVAKTFRVIVLYGFCPSSAQYDVDVKGADWSN